MKKIAVVYWSGTGNTEAMAQVVERGAAAAGAQVDMLTAAEFDESMVASYDAIAFGCPSMGCEQLEESEFEPMYRSVEGSLAGKKVALFGSYGWGDGEWMRNWTEEVIASGADLVCESVICNDAPDDDAVSACEEMGAALTR